MPVYISMLRGINVGGHNRMAMARLQGLLEALGYREVKTYIQSGNAVFRANTRQMLGISRDIERKIGEDFGYSVAVITRSRDELSQTIKQNPFLEKAGGDNFKLHVMFLPQPPEPDVKQALKQLTKPPDDGCLIGKELYLYLPNGVARSSLANNPIERRHLGHATMRNWNTVNALHKLASELP